MSDILAKMSKSKSKKPFYYMCQNCSLIRVNEFDRAMTLRLSGGNKLSPRHILDVAAISLPDKEKCHNDGNFNQSGFFSFLFAQTNINPESSEF